jgi:hypothetical protein
MEMFFKVNARTIRLKGMVRKCMQMGLNTRGTGCKIKNMVKANLPGQMAINMKENTSREKEMETEFSDGLAVPSIMDNSKIIKELEKACKFGLTKIGIKVNG